MKKIGLIITTVIVTIIVLVGIVLAIIINKLGINMTSVIGIISGKKIESNYDHPLLTKDQEELIKSFGIDPASLPTSIPPNLEQCAVDALGADRVKQIKGGAIPTLNDYLKARQCLN